MKTILKNIMLFAAGALTLGFTACEEDGQDLNFKIQPGNELYAPADNASVNLDQGLNTSFEWAPSVAEDGGYITYEVLFDKADGDFSAPLAVKNSQMTGSKASLSISAKELNEVAALAYVPARVCSPRPTRRPMCSPFHVSIWSIRCRRPSR